MIDWRVMACFLTNFANERDNLSYLQYILFSIDVAIISQQGMQIVHRWAVLCIPCGLKRQQQKCIQNLYVSICISLHLHTMENHSDQDYECNLYMLINGWDS